MSRTLRGALVLLLSLFLPTAGLGTVYKWKDKEGQIHYSNRPHPGAQELELRHGPSPEPKTPPEPSPSKEGPPEQPGSKQASKFRGYERITLAHPKPDTAVRSNNGVLTVSVKLEPEFNPQWEHRFTVFLDGRKLTKQPSSPRFELQDISRGTHRLQIQVVNDQGEGVGRSAPVTFHMLRVSTPFNKSDNPLMAPQLSPSNSVPGPNVP